jgi:hypothetical protein
MTKRKPKSRPAAKKSRSARPAARTGNLRDLAGFLGISIPTLTSEIRADPKFPVRKRGGRGVAWVFDFARVAEFRKQRVVAKAALPHVATIAERRAEAQAALAELELQKLRGLVIDREQVLATMSGAYAKLAKAHDRFARSTGVELNWSGETIAFVRARLDEMRRQFVRDAGEYVDPLDPPSAIADAS